MGPSAPQPCALGSLAPAPEPTLGPSAPCPSALGSLPAIELTNGRAAPSSTNLSAGNPPNPTIRQPFVTLPSTPPLTPTLPIGRDIVPIASSLSFPAYWEKIRSTSATP